MTLLNIPASDISAAALASLSVTSGISVEGLHRTLIKSCNSWMSTFPEDIFGMLNLLGENSTVSEILSYIVLVNM